MITPLALLLALFFCVGMTCSPVALASLLQTDTCCDQDAAPAPEFPADAGECIDCGCASCLVVLSVPNGLTQLPPAAATVRAWSLSADPLAGFPRLVDYPPEVA